MISIPLYIFLLIYFAFLFIFVFFSITNLLHMFQTGGLTLLSFIVTFVVAIVTIYTLFLTWYFLQGTNWQQTLDLNIFSSSNDYGI